MIFLDELIRGFAAFMEDLNALLCDRLGLAVLIFAGAFLSLRLRFFQFFHIRLWLSATLGKIIKRRGVRQSCEGAVSQWGALCTALGATVGVGNIAGVASAIISGGPGAVFWMWIAALLGMVTSYCENALAVFYRTKNKRGETVGGAMYYLRDGLKAKKTGLFLGSLFAFSCIVASFGIGGAGQVGAVVLNLGAVVPHGGKLFALTVGIALALTVGAVLLGGIKRASAYSERIVPAMVFIYSLCAIIIILQNHVRAGAAFRAIFRHAFGLRQAAGGMLGYAIKTAVATGFKRGVFSNEAGMGSATLINASANTREPAEQGMWGIFQVFIDTIIMCSLTALATLSSGLIDLESGQTVSGSTALVSEAFSMAFGRIGALFIAISVLLFAFSTIIGWSVLGGRAWEFIFGEESLYIYKFLFAGSIVPASVANLEGIWLFCDTANALMIIPNLTGVLLLSPTVLKITENYLARKRGKKIPPLTAAQKRYIRK